jgi:hypothetical protein
MFNPSRKPHRRSWCRAAAISAVSAVTIAGPSALAQDSKSAPVAKEFAQVLDAAKLDGIAAPDPSAPGTFFAALYIPGNQLLVVSAKYAAPTLLADKIAKKDYREVYIDLTAASVAGTKVFIQDQSANGLLSKPNGDDPADTWEEGSKTVTFDGEWKKAKLSEADYMKAFADADERYAKILGVLMAQAKGKPGS